MEIKEILAQLEYNKGFFPREAVREAIAQKEKIVPHSRYFLTSRGYF